MPRFLLLSLCLLSVFVCACKDNKSASRKDNPRCSSGNCSPSPSPRFDCEACQREGGECEAGKCIAKVRPAQECTAGNCPRGCCDTSGKCRLYSQQELELCGKAGQSCASCSDSALRCVVGTCVEQQPCLSYCEDGCCNLDGACVGFEEQDSNQCGAAANCSPCGQAQRCASGECRVSPVWSVIIRSVEISDKNPIGKNWDDEKGINRLPDSYVESGLGGGQGFTLEALTEVLPDSLTPHWDRNTQSRIRILQRELISKGLEFRIVESDGESSQRVGECSMQVSLGDLKAGSKTLSRCGVDNLASNLRVEFDAQ